MIENITFTSGDNYNDSLFETVSLEYELFLIESEAFSTFGKINNQCIRESYGADLEILQESIKETLTLWLTRFTEALQQALDKFIGIIEGQMDLAYLKSIETKVKELKGDPGFSVNNIRNYKDDVIKGFDIVEFNTIFNTKKDSLENQDKFLIANYSNYGFAEGQTDIKDVLETAIVDVVKDSVNVTPELIRGYYNWCRNNYIEDVKAVQANMNTYNTSVKSIQNIINQLPNDYKDKNQTESNPNVTQNNTQQQKTESFRFNLHEDDTTATTTGNNTTQPQGSQNPAKMEFNDKVDYVGKAGGTNQDTVNMIKVYLTCTTKILSTLFVIIKNRKADYMRVLKHLFPVNREMRNTAATTTNINQNTNNGTPQINTSNMVK